MQRKPQLPGKELGAEPPGAQTGAWPRAGWAWPRTAWWKGLGGETLLDPALGAVSTPAGTSEATCLPGPEGRRLRARGTRGPARRAPSGAGVGRLATSRSVFRFRFPLFFRQARAGRSGPMDGYTHCAQLEYGHRGANSFLDPAH